MSRRSAMNRRRVALLLTWLAALWLPLAANAADPCAGGASRALVLGSGGSRGAFEVGAIYHLVVQRGCDFGELSGTSIGALNVALLAQAARSTDQAQSIANLKAATEDLVAQWESIRDAGDVMRKRPLGKVRLALFGLDSLENFEPLHEFVRKHVSLDRLAAGREMRVATLTLNDGRYHEIPINRGGAVDAATAHDFIFASAVVPVFGRPLLATPPGARAPMHVADGGLRHAVPVMGYFQRCVSGTGGSLNCIALTGADTPPHPHVEQLFVVITNPYLRNGEQRAVADNAQLDNGRKTLTALGNILIDRLHHTDLDDALLYNDLLAWQARAPHDGDSVFPLASFNRAGDSAFPKPYEMAIIAPRRVNPDPLSIFDVDPATQRRQMYCGCIAADDVMRTQFGLPSLGESCGARFPAVPARDRTDVDAMTPAICVNGTPGR